jgi:hypothetical protein
MAHRYYPFRHDALVNRVPWLGHPETVTATKDDAPAADQATISKVAGLAYFSEGGGVDSDHLVLMPTAGGSTPADCMKLTGQLVDAATMTAKLNRFSAVALR